VTSRSGSQLWCSRSACRVSQVTCYASEGDVPDQLMQLQLLAHAPFIPNQLIVPFSVSFKVGLTGFLNAQC
jgi:hypothetical protein